MDRRRFIKSSLAASAGALSLGLGMPGCSTDPVRPNIVYLFSDQHRADAMGASGHPTAVTPHIDRLASEGAHFGRCYCNAPLCRPSRASMMTGLHPRRHGVWTNWRSADQFGPSHVRRLRDSGGYHTALVGKGHLHQGEGHLDDYIPIMRNWGFETLYELLGPGQSFDNRSCYTDWLVASTPTAEVSKYERLKEYVDSQCDQNWESPWYTEAPDEDPWLLQTEDHVDTFTGRVAARFIREYSGSRPFYLQVNFPGPHNPFDATGDFRALHSASDPDLPAGILEQVMEPRSYPVDYSIKFQDVTGMTEEQHRLLQWLYLSKVSLVDAAIGEVIAALEERDLLDNTWIVYGSDHGEMLGDHYLIGKIVFMEGATRVPLIIRPPGGVEGGLRTDALVDQLDVTATIVDIAGLSAGSGYGRSLLDNVEAEEGSSPADEGKEWVLSENFLHGMLRTERHKLVMDYRDMIPVELYDMREDPDELVNLVEDPGYSDIRESLAAQIVSCVPVDDQ